MVNKDTTKPCLGHALTMIESRSIPISINRQVSRFSFIIKIDKNKYQWSNPVHTTTDITQS